MDFAGCSSGKGREWIKGRGAGQKNLFNIDPCLTKGGGFQHIQTKAFFPANKQECKPEHVRAVKIPHLSPVNVKRFKAAGGNTPGFPLPTGCRFNLNQSCQSKKKSQQQTSKQEVNKGCCFHS